MKKAQAATEYLIILAVVIIIALIVIGVMGGIPGMGTTNRIKVSEHYWASQPVGIDSYAVLSNGYYTFVLKNNEKKTLIIDKIEIANAKFPSGTTILSGILPLGGTLTLRAYSGAPGCSLATPPFCRMDATNLCVYGKQYAYAFNISYKDESGTSYKMTGEGNKILLEGICAR